MIYIHIYNYIYIQCTCIWNLDLIPSCLHIGERIEDFSFLGALVECEGRCEKDIRRRITLGKMAIQHLGKILKDKHVSLQTKTRIVNAMIFPVILYGCETWTKTRAMENKIDACEIWTWKKMLRV